MKTSYGRKNIPRPRVAPACGGRRAAMRSCAGRAVALVAALISLSFAPAPTADDGGWWRVYFTSPPGFAANGAIDPEIGLSRLIDGARVSIHGAFYSISSKSLAGKMIEAHRRGVEVRLVLERRNARGAEFDRLTGAGIPVVSDTGRGLMHNKFAIIDGRIVWTGSYNLTENGVPKHNNNAIELESEELARIYEAEFDEMYTGRIFGNRRESGALPFLTQRHYVKIGETDINVYFSPEDNVERIILKRLKKAKRSVHFMAFSFTSDPLGEELIALHKKGVRIFGVMERHGANSRESEFVKMRVEGLAVRLDTNRNQMHHKVIVIDERLVMTGSYNFSKSANRKNDENLITIDDPDIARQYLREFKRIYR